MAISSANTGLRAGVCTSTTRPTAPYTGQIIYETDTGYLRVWDGAAWDYLSQWQATVPGAYQSYTPTFSGFTLGNGTFSARYTQINKYVHVIGWVDLGTTSSMTGPLDVSLPIAANTTSQPVLQPFAGQCILWNGTTLFNSYPISLFGTSFRIVGQLVNGTYSTNFDVTSTAPFTWNSSSDFRWNFSYEAA